MKRAPLAWGGVAALVVILSVAALAVFIGSTATPQAHVERYLRALAADDLVTAARLAGVESSGPIPLGDAGEATVLRIIASTSRDNDRVEVVAEYGGATDAATVIFTLAPTDALIGILPQWRFTTPPIRTLQVGVDHHDEVLVNDKRVATSGAGDTARVTAFIPALLEVGVADPFVEASTERLRLTRSSPPAVMLQAEPTARLTRAVAGELEVFFSACVEQEVLQPSGCPFGRQIDDRVLTAPQWELVTDPVVTLEGSRTPGVWTVRGLAEVGLQVTVQRLFDGRISEVDTTFVASVPGELVIRDGVPRLTFASPSD